MSSGIYVCMYVLQESEGVVRKSKVNSFVAPFHSEKPYHKRNNNNKFIKRENEE